MRNIVIGNPANEINDARTMLYVGLSRATGFNDIFTTVLWDTDMLQKYRPCRRDIETEDNLIKQHNETMIKFNVPEFLQAKFRINV